MAQVLWFSTLIKVKSLDSKESHKWMTLQSDNPVIFFITVSNTAVRQPSDFLLHSFKQAANNAIELAKKEISREKPHVQQLREQDFLFDTSSDEEKETRIHIIIKKESNVI